MVLGWNAQAQPPFYISAQHHQLRSLILSHLLALTKALFPVSLFLYLSTQLRFLESEPCKKTYNIFKRNKTKESYCSSQKPYTRLSCYTIYIYVLFFYLIHIRTLHH